MKNTVLLLSLFVIAITESFAQDGRPNIPGGWYMVDAIADLDAYNDQYEFLNNLTLEDVKGSPYDVEVFRQGHIFSNDTLLVKDIPMRYNIFTDEIEIKKDFNASDDDITLLMKTDKIYSRIANDTYIYVPSDNTTSDGAYFKLVSEGKHINLYKRYTTRLIEKQYAETPYQSDKPARFDTKSTYYLAMPNGKFYELPTKKRKFFKVFKEKRGELEKFAKENKIDIKEEADIIRLMNYYNSIL